MAEEIDETLPDPDEVLEDSEGNFFVVENETRRLVPDTDTLMSMNIDFDSIRTNPTERLRDIAIGPVIRPVRRLEAKTGPQRIKARDTQGIMGGRSWWMDSTATLSETGYLHVRTKTWSSEALAGFKGGVKVLIGDGNGDCICSTTWRDYGVNGTAMGTSSRTEDWNPADREFSPASPRVDREILKEARTLTIVHGHRPDIKKSIDNAIDAAKKVAEIVKIARDVGGGGTTGPPGSLGVQ